MSSEVLNIRNTEIAMAARGIKTQKRLAELMTVSEGTVSNWLSGRSTVWRLSDRKKLAEVLDQPEEFLFAKPHVNGAAK